MPHTVQSTCKLIHLISTTKRETEARSGTHCHQVRLALEVDSYMHLNCVPVVSFTQGSWASRPFQDSETSHQTPMQSDAKVQAAKNG